jgi:hypothetical protein
MLIVVAKVLLTTFFLFASSIKILGWQDKIFQIQLEMFKSYGLNRGIMRLVGVVELFGAIAIWISGTLVAPLGALALLGTSMGALGCHLIFDTWKEGVPAMVTGVLSAIVLWNGKDLILGVL